MQPRITDISSPSNPVLKALKALSDKRGRREAGQFLAEGLRVCTEALSAGQVPETLLFTPEAERHPLTQALIDATWDLRGTILRTTPDLMQRLTGKDHAQAVAAPYPIPDISLDRSDRGPATLRLVAANLQDPGNFGPMRRPVDGTGAGWGLRPDQSVDSSSVGVVRPTEWGGVGRAAARTPGGSVGRPRGWGRVTYGASQGSRTSRPARCSVAAAVWARCTNWRQRRSDITI